MNRFNPTQAAPGLVAAAVRAPGRALSARSARIALMTTVSSMHAMIRTARSQAWY